MISERELVRQTVVNLIRDGIETIECPRFKKKELYNEAMDSFSIQLYVDRKHMRVYLYYRLDKFCQTIPEVRAIAYNRINSHVAKSLYRMTRYRIGLCNDNRYEDRDHVEENCLINKVDSSYLYLRPDTVTYWRCFDGVYRFISDSAAYLNPKRYTYFNGNYRENSEREKEFNKKVLDLNNKYKFSYENNATTIPAAFEEYKKLYKQYFDITLDPIDQDKVFELFYDSYYDGYKDKEWEKERL